MTAAHLYLHALRAARARQLAARLLRPARRRRFPQANASSFRPLEAGERLWRSPAFARAPLDPRGAGTRLYSFHEQYGEDVLEAARAGSDALARQRLETWIAGNPPRPGDAWHPYVVSTRVGNWVAALTLSPELVSEPIRDSLGRQLARLAANVEDDILGNHVIRNARALVLGGLVLGAGGAVAQGMRLLRRELPEQILPDGGHYERSPVYHSIVLRDLLEVEAVTGERFLRPVIDRMKRFAAALTRPDGVPALFNDGSRELAPRLELPRPEEGTTVFPDTGYVVARDGDLWLAFDCGPFSPEFLPAHAHADALSFQLWLGGEAVVIDPGAWTYEGGIERSRLRGTPAHSTVSVDGRSQFLPWGAFRSGPLPRVELSSTSDRSAAGLVEWGDGVSHRRSIVWGPDEIQVRDVVAGTGICSIESRLPVSNGGESRVQGAFTVESAPRSEWLFRAAEGPVLLRRHHGSLPLALGWRIRR